MESFLKSTIQTLNGIQRQLDSLVKSTKVISSFCHSSFSPSSSFSSHRMLSLSSSRLFCSSSSSSLHLLHRKRKKEESQTEIKPFKSIPGPRTFPLLGSSWEYFTRYKLHKLHEAHLDRYQRYGPIVKEEVGGANIVHLYDTKDFEQVFRTQGNEPIRPELHFIKHYRSNNKHRYPSGVGLANSQGKEWLAERQILAPILLKNSSILGIKGQNDICNDLVSYIKSDMNSRNSDSVDDIRDIMYRLALESVCNMCLDTRIGCLDTIDTMNHNSSDRNDTNRNEIDTHRNVNDINRHVKKIHSDTSPSEALITSTKNLFKSYNDLYYSGFPIWKYIRTKSYNNFIRSEKEIYDLASCYIHDKWNKIKENGQVTHKMTDGQSLDTITSGQSMSENTYGQCPVDEIESNQISKDQSCSDHHQMAEDKNTNGSSLLEVLLHTKGMDIVHARVIVVDLIAGGIFTISNSLCYLIHHLASNPIIQERLFNELISILNGNVNQDISSEHLKQMSLLRACIKESFRLTSTVPAIVRVLPQDTILSGFLVPKGTTIFSHFLVTCQLNQYYEDPSKFNPNRWLDGSIKKESKFASLPFGFGPRMCAGRRFAELELMMATAKLVLNFEMESIVPNLERIHAFIVIPSHPIQIRFKSRNV